MAVNEIVYPEFKVLGDTLWWMCPECKCMVHKTRDVVMRRGIALLKERGLSTTRTMPLGADFPCTDDGTCHMRHCVTWLDEVNAVPAEIVSYDRRYCDESKLPLFAQL